MVRKHTPEELAEAERILKESEPLFEKRRIKEQAEKERWAGEIAMLERRVKEEYTEVDLGNGDTIAIRVCLSDEEMGVLGELQTRWADPATPLHERETVTYRILELTTSNPLLTEDWFRENRSKYATSDALSAVLGYFENDLLQKMKRMERLKSAASFRKKPTGSELRGVPASHEDSGPEEMG